MRALARLLCVGMAVFVLLEATARVVLFGARGLDPRRVGLLRDLHPEELVHFDTDPALVYEYRPNLDVYFKLVPFRTNSRGMRDREYAVAKPAGCRRVAVLGSSFALPAGVPIEEAFHSRLEAERPDCTEFLNFAVGMHAPSQFLAMLKTRALPFDPDLVIVSVTRMAVRGMLGPWDRVPPRDVLQLVPSGPRSVLSQLLRSRLGLRPLRFGVDAPNGAPEALPERQAITQLAAAARVHYLPILVLRIEFDPVEPTDLERTLARRAREEGLHYLDTRSAFRGRDPRSYWIYELDPHPNGEAHALFAEALGDFLASEGLLSGSRTRTGRSAGRP